MKFWIDECLTPALVGMAHKHGHEATCTRDRGHLGMADEKLLALAVGEECVFVTNNHADFMGLCANAELHTGLVVLPQRPRDAQLPLFSDAIAHIHQHAEQAREAPADWMINPRRGSRRRIREMQQCATPRALTHRSRIFPRRPC